MILFPVFRASRFSIVLVGDIKDIGLINIKHQGENFEIDQYLRVGELPWYQLAAQVSSESLSRLYNVNADSNTSPKGGYCHNLFYSFFLEGGGAGGIFIPNQQH